MVADARKEKISHFLAPKGCVWSGRGVMALPVIASAQVGVIGNGLFFSAA